MTLALQPCSLVLCFNTRMLFIVLAFDPQKLWSQDAMGSLVRIWLPLWQFLSSGSGGRLGR